jgi:hypothetical protein
MGLHDESKDALKAVEPRPVKNPRRVEVFELDPLFMISLPCP